MNNDGRSAAGPLARAPGASPALPLWARRLAVLLDTALTIPGTNVKIGLDPILGLVLPELGDSITAVVALALLAVAFRERVPKLVMGRMLMNIAFDAVLGAIPLLGDLFDFTFRANARNLELIERHRGDPNRAATAGDWAVVLGVGLLALLLLAVPFVAAALLVRWLLA